MQCLREKAFEKQLKVTYVETEEKSITGISAGVTSWALLV
jgi:hypothetical protein